MSTLAFVSEEETESPENGDKPEKPEKADRPETAEESKPAAERQSLFSGFGIASAVLGVLCVGAIVLTTMIWSGHRDEQDELAYKGRVLQVAVNWAGVLINMNKDNIDTSLQKLHDGTAGSLNTEFDKAIQPYTNLVKTLQSKTAGQINSASLENLYRDPDRQPGTPPPADPLPSGLASRTDTVLIVATSVSEGANQKPQTVRWNLRVGVSDIDGQLLVSRLDFLR
jgi:hypothetical protein